MAQNNLLKEIVKTVDSKTFPTKLWEKRIIVDSKTGEILQNEPGFLSRTKANYYIISNSSNGLFTEHGTSSFVIEDFKKNRSINIKIISKIGCAAGKEDVFLNTLVLDKHAPGLALNDYIGDWISGFVNNNAGEFIDSFFQKRYGENLLGYIRKEAVEIGVTFQDLKYELEGENYLKTKRVDIDKVETNFRNSVEKHTFLIKVALLIDEDNKIKAIATHLRDTDLEKIVSTELREYFPNNVLFEAFDSNRASIENQFKSHLNQILKEYGRKAEAIQIKARTISDVPKIIEKSFTVSINAPEYPKPLQIRSQILVKRNDIAKFNANRPSNFEEWLKKQFEDVVKSTFFGLRYSEIKERFEELKVRIKNELKATVADIGYGLEQIIVIPSFEELKPLEKIEIRIDEIFITSDQEQVKLKIAVDFAINTFEKIREYIDNNNLSLLKKNIEGLCSNEIKQFIHLCNVKEFHKNFEVPQENGEKTSVKSDLTNLIRKKVDKKFGAKISYIFFDRGEDEVIEKMNTLKKAGWTPFKAEIQSVVDYGTTTISSSFLVEGGDLELWQIFRNQDITIENIKKALENALSSNLSVKSSGYLAYKNEEWHEEINKLIHDTAVETVRNDYGINIKLIKSTRELQDREKLMGSDMRTLILESYAALQRDLLEAVSLGDEEREREIEGRLGNLQNKIKKLEQNETKSIDSPARKAITEN